jgi:pimeloyl-ACP methyl ester carboxylesterase
MHVEDAGTGRPVLALHGLGGGAWFFGGLARRLAPDYRLIAVDLPGTGRSTPAADGFSAESWVRDLGELVRTRIGEPVTVLGHSMGTILALKAWEAWPTQINALVFVGGLPSVTPLIRERLSARAEAVRTRGLSGWGRRASPGIFSPATFERLPELVALFERLFEAEAASAYTRSCDILLSMSAESIVPTVGVPCLSITGADDQYAPPALVSGFMRGITGTHRQEVIPACGHLPFLEAPDAFTGLLRSFLRTVC